MYMSEYKEIQAQYYDSLLCCVLLLSIKVIFMGLSLGLVIVISIRGTPPPSVTTAVVTVSSHELDGGLKCNNSVNTADSSSL